MLVSDLERRLLGKLTTPEEVAEAWEAGLRRPVFEQPLYGKIYEFIIDYWRGSQLQSVPTPWALAEEHPGYVPLEGVQEETWFLAKKLRERYVTNVTQEMVRRAVKDSPENPEKALKELHATAYAALEVVVERKTRVNMADTIDARRERYEHREKFPQGLGVTYGLDLLDLHTGGIQNGEIAVVAAFAKTGKTMFLLNAAVKALRMGFRPIVFTLELSLDDTQERLDAMFSGVSYNRLTHSHLRPEELQKLHEAQIQLKELGGLPVERPEEGDRTVAYLCSRTRELGCNYLIIDQLSKMEAVGRTDTVKEKRASVITSLKNEVARPGLELPVLIAHQLRREEADEPTLKSLAEAAEIEREVDMVLAIHRTQDMRNNHSMACDILGSRRTDMASYLLEWELTEYTSIRTIREGKSQAG